MAVRRVGVAHLAHVVGYLQRKEELKVLARVRARRDRARVKLEALDEELLTVARRAKDEGAWGDELAEAMGCSLRTVYRRLGGRG